MKFSHESVFFSTLRAFFVTLFGTIGIACGIVLIFLFFGMLLSPKEERHHVDSNVKILPDASGSRKVLAASAPVILQIEITGEIGKGSLTAEDIQEILVSSREKSFRNGRVKAIFLSINSPGGSANETYLIYQQLMEYKKRYNVPIYAYVDGLCASGGYYIACAADKIYATEVSLVGSIGVLAWPPYFNVADALDKLGIETKTLTAGKGKDAMNPTRKWTPEEEKGRQQIVDFFYGDFVDVVVKNREQITEQDLVKSLGAEIFSSPKSKELGLIDEIVPYRTQALQQLTDAVDISDSYQVVCFKTEPWWKDLFKEKFLGGTLSGKMRHEIVLPGRDPFSFYYE